MGTKNKRSGRGAGFYVNQATGSDTLDTGRGESSSKPFKTIQSCVNYVCDNYNISRYTATINVAAGTYAGPITLPEFTKSSGKIVLKSQTDFAAIITNSSNGNCLQCAGGYWNIEGFKFVANFSDNETTNALYFYTIHVYNNGILEVGSFDISCLYTGESVASVRSVKVFHSGTGGSIRIQSTTKAQKVVFDKGNATNLHVFHVEGDSTISTNSYNVSQDYCNMEVSGVCSVFCTVDTGIFSRSFGGNYAFKFTVPEGSSVTGQRYYAQFGGRINTNNGGDEFFPGTSAGAVQASTYSWYR